WTSPLGQRELERLSRGFASLDGVAEVRSLVQPVGFPWIEINPDPRDQRIFNQLMLLVQPMIKAWHDDVIVEARDHDMAKTESDRLRVNGFVLLAILAILLVLVRRVWLAAYLLVTVLASYYAALGATMLAGVFWTGHILTHVDWRVPFFLFTILVAVGEDYNILLMSRAIEERKKHGGVEGTRRALAHTGGTITSCGLIMAGTFATLMLAGLNTLVQVRFALAF